LLQLLTPDSSPSASAPLSSTHPSLPSAISSAVSQSCPRTFLIGGAELYNLSLDSPQLVNRVLLTRINSDIECDTFLTDFAAQEVNGRRVWRLSSHSELEEWVGFEVPRGEVEEKGIKYRFEMWVLDEQQEEHEDQTDQKDQKDSAQ
jgi:dihydrofolate reductase